MNLRIKFPVSSLKEGVMVLRSAIQKFDFSSWTKKKYHFKHICNMDKSWLTYDVKSKEFKVITKEIFI